MGKDENWNWLDSTNREQTFVKLLGDCDLTPLPSTFTHDIDAKLQQVVKSCSAVSLFKALIKRYELMFEHNDAKLDFNCLQTPYYPYDFESAEDITFNWSFDGVTWKIFNLGNIVATFENDAVVINKPDMFYKLIKGAVTVSAWDRKNYLEVDCQLSASFVDLALGGNRT